ncbi:MAG TPA: pentapeptide repeat-containing protein [Gemmatimonadaceae bacterium]|nr:pentapeptide repeat-containing protein [Gemmatimonadaceae bacterium]
MTGTEPTSSTGDLAAALRASRDWRKATDGSGTSLVGVDLSGADLRGVDFRGADLSEARLVDAKLADAQFEGARLAHADLSGATGLVGSQFARADLTGAMLPAGVRFSAFETANEVAEGTGKLFVTMLLVCAYSWLTINSTLDAKLLTDTATSKLPILNAELPIVNFYALVPLAIVGVAIVAMLQAQRLWSAVAAAPSVLPDGTAMADRASTWLIGSWAAERLSRPGSRSALAQVQAWATLVIGWWFAPLTVLWFWERYLHRHDWMVTSIQVVALTIGCAAATAFLILAARTVPRPGTIPSQLRARHAYLPVTLVGVGVPIVVGAISFYAITGIYHGIDPSAAAGQPSQTRLALKLEHTVPTLHTRVPAWMAQFGVRPVAQLSESEVSTRLAASSAADTLPEAKAAGARLIGADLRFASAERVYLALADLRQADLLGADLWGADLRGAHLTGASLVGSLLYQADLRRARAGTVPIAVRIDSTATSVRIDTLLCERALFTAANLRYARMSYGDFRGATFDDALLQGAKFTKARLQHATFAGADLGGVDFRGAYGLQADQILAARHVDALYDSVLFAQLKAKAPDRMAGYDVKAIEDEVNRQRESGEDEPDSVSAEDDRLRNGLMRTAFEQGAAAGPPGAAVAKWTTHGDLPFGCIVARTLQQSAQPSGHHP